MVAGRCIAHREKVTPPSTQALQAAFLTAYARLGTITDAAEACEQDRGNHRRWAEDPDYMARFQDAQEQCVERLEREADRRAVEGVRRLKFHKGELIQVPAYGPDGEPLTNEDGTPVLVPYVEHQYSDLLLMFRLKKLRPEYRDRQGAEQLSEGAQSIAVKLRQAIAEMGDLHRPAEEGERDDG